MDPVTYNININGIDGLTSSAATAAVGGVVGFTLVACAAIAILLIIACWKIFEKAGEKGWKSLIPIYNGYILFKICGIKNWFWVFFGIALLSSVLMGINPPITQTTNISTVGSNLSITSSEVAIDWNQHVPYLIGMILEAISSIAVAIAIAVKLARAFGKGVGFTFGLIFLSGIFYMILGFGKAKYDKKAVNV